ncbi:Dyp-type peroxidase [Ectothiorhodospiraceae bacterium BW-2]|nr:Dyp-type peroxidase [Ectothiorhodospiraceae bacterium BW-2]
MERVQNAILQPVPAVAQFINYQLCGYDHAAIRATLNRLAEFADGEHIVVGLGHTLFATLDKSLPGLSELPVYSGPKVVIPSTPAALWVWLRSEEPGTLLHHRRALDSLLRPLFEPDLSVDAYTYREGRDLTGYLDGTENPSGDRAREVALIDSSDPALHGSSFVAVQQWLHRLDIFEAMSPQQQDETIGRRISDNEEIEEAPASAHVKRTAQESFAPEAFILRRSMPWSTQHRAGLVFVAFGHSLDAYQSLLRQMSGQNDGIVDALFSFSRPISGNFFWCPPLVDGGLNLRALGL